MGTGEQREDETINFVIANFETIVGNAGKSIFV